MKQQLNFSLINLWCTKNLVDSQYFLGRLFDISIKTPEYQIQYFTDPFDTKTDVVFLNTCGFISSGRDEADATLKKLLKAKKTVYLMWCSVQYYKKLKQIRVCIIDNGSSFIDKLSATFRNMNYDIHLVANTKIHTINENDYDLFVLSGMKQGRSVMRHEEHYRTEIEFVKKCTKPLLGICLWHEIVCKAFGSTLTELPKKQEWIYTISFDKNDIFSSKRIEVYEWHKFWVKALGKQLIWIAKSNHWYEIVHHKNKPIFWFQFHPEQTTTPNGGTEILVELLSYLWFQPEWLVVPNVHYLSRGDLNKVNLKNIIQWYDSNVFGDFEFSTWPRVYTNLDQKFEYLKIAEWCDNHCTFCIIPKIRGKQQSLPIEKILTEARQMIKSWIKEIILIAQDTTRYGTDLYKKPQLLALLKKLDALKWVFTYRLLYLYPDIVTLNQIKELKKLKKFIPYFDIPLQHISSPVLKKMGRFYDEWYIIKFLDQIKKTFPIRFTRTNLIIGFPGETEKDFEKLMKFVDETSFDNIALFEYHDEELAASNKLPNKVDYPTIRERFTKIRQLVNKQLMANEQARKGKEEIWYIMEIEQMKDKKVPPLLVIRPALHCPEIDSYDEISLDHVVGTYEPKDELEIWDKIIYIV